MGLPEILGTIPGWIMAFATSGILGLLLRHKIQAGRLALDGERLAMDGDVNIRDHYAKEVAALREQLNNQSRKFREDLQALDDRWRNLLKESEDRHEECLKDRDALRGRVNTLEDELRGLIRVITQASIDRVLMLGTELPDDIRAAAERVEEIIKERGRE